MEIGEARQADEKQRDFAADDSESTCSASAGDSGGDDDDDLLDKLQPLRIRARPRIYGVSGDLQCQMSGCRKQRHEGARIRKWSPPRGRLWRFEKKSLRFWKRRQLDANSYSSALFASRDTNYTGRNRMPFEWCFRDDENMDDVDMSKLNFSTRRQVRDHFWNLLQTKVDLDGFVYFASWNVHADVHDEDPDHGIGGTQCMIEQVSRILDSTHTPSRDEPTEAEADGEQEREPEDFRSFDPLNLKFTHDASLVGVHMHDPDEERALLDLRLNRQRDFYRLLNRHTDLMSDLFPLVYKYLEPTLEEEQVTARASIAHMTPLNPRQVPDVVACLYSAKLQQLLPLFTFTAGKRPHTPTNDQPPFLREKMLNQLLHRKRTVAKRKQREEKERRGNK